MLRLYLDEDTMARALVQGLRARGVDVLTVAEADQTGEEEATQLAFAAAHTRTLYTFNVADFCGLHNQYMREGLAHAGIPVVPRQRYGIGTQVRNLSDIARSRTVREMQNQLIFL